MKPHQAYPRPGEPLYSPDYYDADYYGKGARGGFPSYDFADPKQKEQLDLKWQFSGEVPHENALFVGCARGFEVAHWLAKGRRARGVDVSTWAIANQIPEAIGLCHLYDGRALPFADDGFDLVASFDVLHHLPLEMLEELAPEIVRVAKNGIVWRLIVKNWRNLENPAPIEAQDGAWFAYRRLEFWDALFTRSGKFRLHWLKMHEQYEVTAIFRRVAP
jgi:hypothetical protein